MRKDLTIPEDGSIPAFLKRKLPKKAITSEYVAPKAPEIKTPGWGKKEKLVLVEDKPKVKAYRPTIQEAIKEKHSNIIGEVEGMIDDGGCEDFFKYLNSIKATPMATRAIAEKLAPQALELNEVLSNPDDLDLQEGYMYLSNEEVETLFNMISGMIDDCTRYASINRKAKALTKKKVPSKEKLVKNLKYLDKDDKYKIASIDPGKIVGAIEMWTFNVKTRQLTVLRALDRAGLSIKGTSITNIDEKGSMTKLLRKPEETIQEVLSGGKIILKKLMDNLSTKKMPHTNTRTNKFTIILKVV